MTAALAAQERAAVEAVDLAHFAWPQRRERVLSEIMKLDADLLSLVDRAVGESSVILLHPPLSL